MVTKYFNCHNHTMYSNIRLLDCINRPKELIDKAIELGLTGIAITDHECLSAHMEVNKIAKEYREKYPDFTIALGNEIYLIEERSPQKQHYFHFIVIAKDEIGYRALRELSSTAWFNMYNAQKMDRVPTLKSELKEIMAKYKGHVIATSACIGGELSKSAQGMELAMAKGDTVLAQKFYNNIISFIEFVQDIFGDDFYIECAPSTSKDQVMVNKKLLSIARYYNIPMVVGTDAHYLTAADRPIHKAYLTSKDDKDSGSREVDAFYEFARLMDADECRELLNASFEDDSVVDWIFENTMELQNKISWFSLEKTQIIPKVDVTDYPKQNAGKYEQYPTISRLLDSDNIQERYWINEVLKALCEKGLDGKTEYVERIETEADVVSYIGEKLHDCLFAYFNTFKHYIDLFWECGSIVGPGRGSATGFLSNYLLGITQLDPIRWQLPYWRFLNKERAELPDIDIDLAPSKRPAIFDAIRKERGEFGLVQVATFGTEGTKSAIQTACRGYRSDEYPDGINNDDALYMSSLIPQERGFLWDIDDVVHGNEERGRQPVTVFINEVNRYPGLLDIITYICGLVNKRSSHASGVILYAGEPYDTASVMRTPSGDLITCFDLHEAEAAGDTKYDFLLTEASDKIIQCYELLKRDGEIPDISLREFYNQYLHPEVMDLSDQRIWDHLGNGDVLDIFQFATGVGLMIAKKLRPQNILEMTAASALMRLMAEKGKESPQDRYVRIKNNPEMFEDEMDAHELTEAQKAAFHKHCDAYYGTVPLQEQMMEILMDENIAGFTLGEANAARKIVAKKQMKKIPELRKQLYEKVANNLYASYIWEVAVAPSLGYAFSKNHSLPYSFVGVQMIYLAINFSPVYWNTACLIVNSGATDPEAGKATDYAKIAKAIGDVRSAGIDVSIVNINESDYGFIPDAKNNRILFGLKGMVNVGDELVAKIIEKRPYTSPKDFYYKVKPQKQAMVSLIKGGAFDDMYDRRFVMAWYIWETCDKKSNLTLQNLPSLMKYGLLPEDTEERVMARRIYEFNRYLKAKCAFDKIMYRVDERAIDFLTEIGYENLVMADATRYFILLADWDKIYQKWMDVFRNWIAADKQAILDKLNNLIFTEDWNKYAKGNLSSWEMDSLCFYYHEHELAHVQNEKYGFVNFFDLPKEPVIAKRFGNGGKMFQLSKICGTVLGKNKTKSTVSLLTVDGVVNVKFRKEHFSMFDKRISQIGDDGVKHVVENSWFSRGSMIVVNGMRNEDDFVAKKYQSQGGHQLYKIDEVSPDGTLILRSSRYYGSEEDED